MMTSEQRRYIFVQSPIGSAIVNAVLNGAIGWAIVHAQSDFAIWQVPGVAVDLVATAFGVAFGTCIGANLQVRMDLSRGKITAPAPLPFARLIARFPDNVMKRAVLLGVTSVPVFVPVALFALGLSGLTILSSAHFIALKAAFSALEGALITPLILIAALDSQTRDAQRRVAAFPR